ncbi:MAG: Smr/MutS family protein [bacterium]
MAHDDTNMNRAWAAAARERPADPIAFALTALEFDRIREWLAGFCSSELGAGHAWRMVPSSEPGIIAGLLQETGEAEAFLHREMQPLSAGGLRDLRKQATLAGKGGVLGMAPLYYLGRVCTLTNEMKTSLETAKGSYPALQGYGLAMGYLNHVAHRCEATFENEETIKDTATPALKQIRRGIQEQQSVLHDKAQKLGQRLYQSGILTTPSFTIRNGRYVLPFQSGAMGRIPAVIQGTSESGATIWAEPNELVEANNKLAQLRLQEEQEIERILLELSDLVGHHAVAICTNIEIAAQLDVILARARLSRTLDASRPSIGTADGEAGTEIRLIEARHPMIPKDRVIASDIIFGGTQRGLIITGPNAGGKTVALKTLGLLACMAQSGLFIPAKPGSALPLFGAILAEIGDQQSLELDLSSFSGHIQYLKRCLAFVAELAHSDRKPLILLDEIGRATDPQEGSAVALALTEKFITAGAYFAITTHLPALKNLVIGGHPNIIGGAVSFNVEKLEPEYRLQIPGVGASYAIIVTEKMGLDKSVVERAKALVGKQFRILELEIPGLERRKRQLEEDIANIEGKWMAQERREAHHFQLLLTINRLSQQLLGEAIETASEIVKDARRKVARLAQKGKASETIPQGQIQAEAEHEVQRLGAMRAELDAQSRGLARAVKSKRAAESAVATVAQTPASFVVGTRVWIPMLKREGEVLALKKAGTVADVSVDGKRLTMDVGALDFLSGQVTPKREKNPRATYELERPKDIPLWLDLHGERVLEALERLEDFLQGAYLQRRGSAQIVHGVGTGKLRAAIWKYLRSHPLVLRYEEAPPESGGLGVTIVTFRE